jgi:signal transduction histidine kinase/ActR/RegA family two-component response regulator
MDPVIWLAAFPIMRPALVRPAMQLKEGFVNVAPGSDTQMNDLLSIVSQLMSYHEPKGALPLLQALNRLYNNSLCLCLPPINDNQPFSITNVAHIQAWLDRGDRLLPQATTEGNVVLKVGETKLGMLTASSSTQTSKLQQLGTPLSIVLDHWQQYRLSQRAHSEKETIVRLCRAANAHHDLSAVLAEAYEALYGLVPFDSFVATVYDPATEMNKLSYIVDDGQRYIDSLTGPVPNSLQGYLIRHRKPLHFDDLHNELQAYPEIQVVRIGTSQPKRAWLGVPLLLGDGRAVGILSVQHRSANVYSEHDCHFLEQVAVPVATAIEKAMLLQQRDREIAVLTSQIELSESLGHAHDIRAALDSALTAISHSFPSHAYLMYVLDDMRRVEASILKENDTVYRDEGLGKQLTPASLSSYIMLQPKPVLFNSEQEIIEAGISWSDIGDPDQPATEAVIGAALHASDGSQMGLISVQSYHRNAFDQRHAALLGGIARQVALVVENARLIQQDQQRLHALEQANRDLELARHRAVEAERRRAIGDIAAGVAHDFNNLLGAILGNAQLIGLARTLEDAQEMAATIEVAARDAAIIVRRIQEFTRSSSPAVRTPVDVHALLRSAIDITRPKWRDEAQLRGVLINVHVDYAPVERVLGIEAELREVLVNLMVNAVDAMTTSGTLALGCEQHGTSVHVYVRDMGIGMTPDILAHAGQPFFSTKGSNGSGLGLAVSQGVVQRHGGELVIESVQGRGTTVTLQLPAIPTQPAEALEKEEIKGRAGRIVLVEDDPHVRVVTQRILEHAGHHVSAFATGMDALCYLQETPVDIVLTDLGLPGLSGWDVARSARACQPSIEVLIATGWGDRVAPEDARRSGVMAVLSKPLEQHELLDAINHALHST